MTNIRPFRISIPQEKLDRLKQKLALADLPPAEAEGEKSWSRGVPLADLKRVLNYWISSYDWRKTEERLNANLPQFTTDISVNDFGSFNIHFVHQQSKVKNAIPLLFLHGWPGQFSEVEKILPLLMEGNGKNIPAFHVVAPSLVDYGFSDRCTKSGFSLRHHGSVYHKLMLRLGYEKYVIQGGDLGYFISRVMVQQYQAAIGGHLINLATPRRPTKEEHPKLWQEMQGAALTDEEKRGMELSRQVAKEGMGYHLMQRTKPQTLGYSMADSPVGLLAWIYDKLHDWTDNYPWTEEEILQWVCIYYFSKAGPSSSIQVYYESVHDKHWKGQDNVGMSSYGQRYSEVPLGISRFPKELARMPKLWHHTLGPLVFWNIHDSGGHFAAWERPVELVDDIRAMFGREGGAANCCGEGRTGYEDEGRGKRSKL